MLLAGTTVSVSLFCYFYVHVLGLLFVLAKDIQWFGLKKNGMQLKLWPMMDTLFLPVGMGMGTGRTFPCSLFTGIRL